MSGIARAADAVLHSDAAGQQREWRAWSGCSRSCRRRGSRTSSSTAIRATRSRAARVPLGNRQGLLDLRALGDKYGLRFPARHGSLSESTWEGEIAAAKILGQEMVGEGGAGGAGGLGNLQQTLATATQLNKLGKRSVEAGVGPAYFHNHNSEFSTRFADDDGVVKSAWEIVMSHTDPRWVAGQIDIGWAVCGASGHATPSDPAVGADYVNRMIQKFGRRVVSFHVKDMAAGGIKPGLRRRRPAHGRPGRHQLRADVHVGQGQDEVLLRRARPGRARRGDELQPVPQRRRGRGRDARRRRPVAEGGPDSSSPRCPRARPRRPTSSRSRSPTTATRRS